MSERKRGKDLTPRQKAVLNAIRSWIKQYGYPPTIRELGQALGIKSLRGVTTHLDAIAKKGFLKREPRARSISLTEGLRSLEQALKIPVLGHISAGKPLLAEENVQDHVVIDASWIGKQGLNEEPQHFALKVKGDSMIGAGIFNGDFVIVRHQQVAQNGDIVVALLGDEATVKRLFKESTHIRLQPENPSMEPIIVNSEQDCAVLGKVVAVFRSIS